MLPSLFTNSGNKLFKRLNIGFSEEDKVIQRICFALTSREKLARAMAERIGDSTIGGAASFLTFPEPGHLLVDRATEALYNVRQYTSPDKRLAVLTANRDMIGGLNRGLQAGAYVQRDIYIKFDDKLVFGITNTINLCSNFPVGFIKPRKEWISFLLAESHRVSNERGGVATGIDTDPSRMETFPYSRFQVEMPAWDKKNVVYKDDLAAKAASFYGTTPPTGPQGAGMMPAMSKTRDLAQDNPQAQALSSEQSGVSLTFRRPGTTRGDRLDLSDLSRR